MPGRIGGLEGEAAGRRGLLTASGRGLLCLAVGVLHQEAQEKAWLFLLVPGTGSKTESVSFLRHGHCAQLATNLTCGLASGVGERPVVLLSALQGRCCWSMD